ncbi:MAG: SpoIIE family protein phosphatase [Eubacterium sp.]
MIFEDSLYSECRGRQIHKFSVRGKQDSSSSDSRYGAATTFVKREDGVEMIASSALPVGVDLQAEPDVAIVQLQEGDMVIMVSDGVLDSFYERNIESDSQEEMATLIDRLYCKNANDMANQILMNTLAHSTKEASDDMSVLVAGIWNKV